MALNAGTFRSERFDLLTFASADPGAGNDFNVTVPDNRVHQCMSLQFNMVTSVVAADRVVSVRILSGALSGHQAFMPFIQEANTERNYYFAVGIASADLSAVAGVLAYQTALPCGFVGQAEEVIQTTVHNMDAGDVITGIEQAIRVWRIQ